MNGFRLGWVLLAGAALAGCVSSGITPERVQAALGQAPERPIGYDALPVNPFKDSVEYRLGPFDVLSIEVFDMPALTRDSVPVSAVGEIALPLIGRIPAAGKTPAQLEQEITDRLHDGFLENPQVTVFVKDYQSQRVTVEGAVSGPGIYPLSGHTSLLQLIAMAHGLVELANPSGCVVFREREGKRYAAVFDLRKIRSGRMVDPEVLGGDMIVVDFSGARANYRDFLMSIPAFGVYRQISGR